jgi:CubicO group peptidase (beta-lactamase class C family)
LPRCRGARTAIAAPAILLALLHAAVVGGSWAAAPEVPGDLDAGIEKAMRDWEIPGVAIAIVRKDRLVSARGYGVREAGRPGPVDADTLFAIASNTKAVTATALGLMVADGRIGWDDPVSRHLPEFRMNDPWADREITVRDLLTHRSGLARWGGDLIWYGSDFDRAEVLRRVRFVPPARGFRSGYGYCNLAFIAAGEIIPQVAGVAWDDFVRAKFLRPLGMKRTDTRVAHLARQENVARPHTSLNGKLATVPYRVLDNTGPAGAINSSAREWARWIQLQLGGGVYAGRRLVPGEVIEATRTPQFILPIGDQWRRLSPTTHFSAYGLGWFLQDYHGRLVVSHGGGMDGMYSYTGFLPEEDLGVVVLTNRDDHEAESALFFMVVDAMLGLPRRDWSGLVLADSRAKAAKQEPRRRVEGTRPSLPPEGYAGVYANPMLGEARVIAADGALRVEFVHHRGARGPLAHWHHDTYEAAWADPYFRTSLVTFAIDPAGRAAEFRVRIREDFVDPLEYVFTREEERR